MLATFRENARSWFIQLAIAAIALVFIFSFGAGSKGWRGTGGASDTWAARVNGHDVPVVVFQELYGNQMYRLQQYGMTNPEQLRAMKIREEVMKELVEEELLAQAAEKSGIYVSDEELAKVVRHSGRFSDPESGKFDPERYRDYIDRVESTKSFEGRMRRMIMSMRESELATAAIPVSDDEIRTELMKQDEGASIAFVKFLPGNFRDQVQVDPAAVEAQLKDHLADVQKKYDDTKMLYTEPRAIKARRLFVPVKQDAKPEEEAAAKKKVEDAKAALASGKKWEELAPQFTEDSMTGGDLGWVQLGRSTVGRSTEEAIFKLKIGDTSDVVHDRFGYEVLQALEDRPAAEKKFDDVKKDIATDIVREAGAKELAKAAAQKSLEQLKAGVALETQYPKQEKPAAGAAPNPMAVADANKPHTVVTSEFHPTGGMIPEGGSAPKVSAVAFTLSASKRVPDAVIEDSNALWVIELKSRTRADLSKLDKEKETLREKVAGEKRAEVRKGWVDHLREKATIEENPDLLSYDQKMRNNQPVPDDS